MKIDFHVHTIYSKDGLIRPKDLVKKARALDITPAIADHNKTDAHAALREFKGFEFIPGEEIDVAEGFDLIGLYLNEQIPKHTPFHEAVDLIKAQGGLVYVPHPFDITRSGMGNKHVELAKQADIIEVFNARIIIEGANKQADELAGKYKKLKAAGSDSHYLFEFGSTYTEINDSALDLQNPKALLKALKNCNPNIVGKTASFYVRGTAELVTLIKRLGLVRI